MTTDDARRLRLSLNLSGVGRHGAAWLHPSSDPGVTLDVDHYVDVARIAERGGFTSVFLADGPVVGTQANTIPHRFEPFELLTAVALATERIGLIGTLSATYNDPYVVAERVLSLDHLSGGRAAINIVASSGDQTARNFGLEHQPDHSTRYGRVQEFIDVLRAIWDGTAIGGQRYYAPYDGRRAIPSPQGRPVIVQAGGSPRGRTVAAGSADAVYAGSSTIGNAQAFYADVRARAAAAGRDPDSVKILPGAVPYVASTEREARLLAHELDELGRAGVDVISPLGALLGLDLSDLDPEGPVPLDQVAEDTDLVGGVSLSNLAVTLAREEGLSVRALAERIHDGHFGNIQWKPTGTPEQVADELERWFRAGTGDGFNLMVPVQPASLEVFVDEVVPILRSRGLLAEPAEGSTLREGLGLTVPVPVEA